MSIDFACDFLRHAGGGFEVDEARAFNAAGAAEMVEQGAFAGGADAGDFVEFAGDEGFGAAGAVGGDGEAVGFVAQALQEVEDGVAR